MNIIYLSSVCAQRRFDRLVNQGLINRQFQNQKFHHLLLKGLSEIEDLSINVVSFYPINRVKGLNLKYEKEEEDDVHYFYPNYTNKPVFHHITKFLRTYQFIKKHRQPDSIIICNIMNFDECQAALLYRCFHKVKVCAIVADVPGITSGAAKANGALWKRILTRMAAPFYRSANGKYDGYFFLTEAMNDVVNKKKNPFVVVEGIADAKMQGVENRIDKKYNKKTILYAGGLHREYGIQLLVEAFKKLEESDVELHIYGKGNYVPELEKAAEADPRIKYFGTRSNQEIVAEQVKAHILVNPRPTKEDFVKYSFPSKIMECMASGTPLLTTRLPGIPEEYYTHIYTIDDETIDGVYKSLKLILDKPIEELHQKGQMAKTFIISKKNPKMQASKLVSLINIVIDR